MISKKISKSLSALLSLVIILSTLSIGAFAYGSDLVAINSANFADSNFRTVVSDWYDENADGYLSQDEIGGVTLISVSGMLIDSCGDNATIEDLSGIEYFTACKRLRCGGIGLTSLDVTKMPQLVELTCAGNELSSIDISKNTNLQWLNCSSNAIENLDITKNTALTRLDCYVNRIKSLDVSKNTGLTILRCQQNELESLDISKNTAITTFNCSQNHLKSLDLSANVNIEEPTDSYYGNQVIEAKALKDNDEIYVRVTVDDYTKVVSSSLDKTIIIDDVEYPYIGYNVNEFVTEDIEDIMNGIDYNYAVGLDGAENMSVHINVQRDFYQVKFFTDESKTTVIDRVLVNKNMDAPAPQITDIPQCKLFSGWVGDYTNVTDDREVYASWTDDHDLKIISFIDNVVTINCKKCNALEEKHNFPKMMNARSNSDKYVPLVDINNDGIINGKDYVYLYKGKY